MEALLPRCWRIGNSPPFAPTLFLYLIPARISVYLNNNQLRNGPPLLSQRGRKSSHFFVLSKKRQSESELPTTAPRFLLILLQQNISNKSQDLYINYRVIYRVYRKINISTVDICYRIRYMRCTRYIFVAQNSIYSALRNENNTFHHLRWSPSLWAEARKEDRLRNTST